MNKVIQHSQEGDQCPSIPWQICQKTPELALGGVSTSPCELRFLSAEQTTGDDGAEGTAGCASAASRAISQTTNNK